MGWLRWFVIFLSLCFVGLGGWNWREASEYARGTRALRGHPDSSGRVLLDGEIRLHNNEWVPVRDPAFRGRAVARKERMEMSWERGLERIVPVQRVPFNLRVGGEELRVVGDIASLDNCREYRSRIPGGSRIEMVLREGDRPYVVGYLGRTDDQRALVQEIFIDCLGSDALLARLDADQSKWRLVFLAGIAGLLGVAVGSALLKRRSAK